MRVPLIDAQPDADQPRKVSIAVALPPPAGAGRTVRRRLGHTHAGRAWLSRAGRTARGLRRGKRG